MTSTPAAATTPFVAYQSTWGLLDSAFVLMIALVILFAIFIIPLVIIVHQWKVRRFTTNTWLLLVFFPWLGFFDTLFLPYRPVPYHLFPHRNPYAAPYRDPFYHNPYAAPQHLHHHYHAGGF